MPLSILPWRFLALADIVNFATCVGIWAHRAQIASCWMSQIV